MAFHIQQGHPTPQTLEPGANSSFTIEVFVDGNPVDPGDNNGRDPGRDGGLPKIWLRPPPHAQSVDVAGIKVDTGNHSQPPPEGYSTSP